MTRLSSIAPAYPGKHSLSRAYVRALAIGVFTTGFLFGATSSAAAEEVVERCSLGPAPDSPDFFRHRDERDRLFEQLGYEPVCDEYIPSLPPPVPLEPFEKAREKLAFEPIPLDGTLLATYRLLGARHGVTIEKRGSSVLTRYFAGSNGEILELSEFDLSLGGAQLVDPKYQSERVKGFAATLTVLQSKSGKAFSHLAWEEGRRAIGLGINRNINASGRAGFFRIAESLPTPTPADPTAPVPDVDWPPPFGMGEKAPVRPWIVR